MRCTTLFHSTGALVGVIALLGAADASVSSSPLADFTAGNVQLASAGPLAFGPEGILFVGDSAGGQVVAIDTQDRKSAAGASVNVTDIDAKVAAMVGVPTDQIVINDVKVNPLSKNVYLSASRGRGPDAMPLIVRVSADSNQISVLSLDNIAHSSVRLTDAPTAQNSANARANRRMLTITDMAYMNGELMVAGLSNEEWSSALRAIPFPFQQSASEGATIQIWHASHGRYETEAPIRTFVPYTIDGRNYVLAAYTCTPLVKIALSDLQPGAKVRGTTIADLGSGNQPLDMVPYRQNGHDYILINNSSRGVMKLKADELGRYQPIDSPTVVDVAGVPYQTIDALRNVQHLAQLDEHDVLMLSGSSGPSHGSLDLRTVALP